MLLSSSKNAINSIHLFNTKTQKIELFIPIDPNNVRMYVCGPTVYDKPHIGNARPGIVFDILRRLLENTYTLTHVSNITDIDDKIINAALAKNTNINTITQGAFDQYMLDMEALNVKAPTFQPKATEYVERMCLIIKDLLEKGFAYIEKSGDVLFNTAKYENYGCFGKPSDENADFVLWKNVTPIQEALEAGYCWETPPYMTYPSDQKSYGRPGWHLECTAMSTALLGSVFDIHGGGIDLSFPHHENERAQSCAFANVDDCANYWVHNGLIQFQGGKMSKSVGNIMFLDQINQQFHALSVRLYLLQTHYRQTLNWSQEGLEKAHKRLTSFYKKLKNIKHAQVLIPDEFIKALSYDLNTPQALALIDQMLQTEQLEQAYACLDMLGLIYKQGCLNWLQRKITPFQKELLEQRQIHKLNKNFIQADLIRKQLLTEGINVEDNKNDYFWHMI